MAEQKEPRHLLVFRILGFLLLFGGITLVILGAVVFREEWGFHGETIINSKLFTPGMFASFLSVPALLVGFSAKIAKASIASEKYIQQSTKEDLKDIADTSANITSDAVTTTVKAVKKGIKDTKYCSECGAEIEADSKFCRHCGKNQ